jgi:hypothetical protein
LPSGVYKRNRKPAKVSSSFRYSLDDLQDIEFIRNIAGNNLNEGIMRAIKELAARERSLVEDNPLHVKYSSPKSDVIEMIRSTSGKRWHEIFSEMNPGDINNVIDMLFAISELARVYYNRKSVVNKEKVEVVN